MCQHFGRAGTLSALAVLLLGAAGPRDLLLIDAVKSADVKAVRAMVQRHVDVNAAEADGTTALHWAVHQDDVEMVQLLIKAGANVKAANRYGTTPLVLACTNGNAVVIESLLTAGADVNAAQPSGETALMTAARTGNVDALQMLIAHGADVNARESRRKQTALMWAAAENNAAAIPLLVEAGADLQARSDFQAPQKPTREYVRQIGDTTRPEYFQRGNGGIYNQNEVVEGFTPLLFAVRAGHIPAVRALLTAGASANESAASDGMSALVLAAVNAHWELGVMLLEHGADPNVAAQGWTALHQVAVTRRLNSNFLPHPVATGRLSSLDFAKKLVEYGANVNARMTKITMGDGYRNLMNRMDATPFLLAAKGDDPDMMRWLLAQGADPFLTNADNHNALQLSAGVAVFAAGEDAGTEEEALDAVKLCLQLGFAVNAADNASGDTALHGAAYKGFNSVVQYLVEQGAQLDVKNKSGWTPLIIATGVFYSDTTKKAPHTATLLVELLTARGMPAELSVNNTGGTYVDESKSGLSNADGKTGKAVEAKGTSDEKKPDPR